MSTLDHPYHFSSEDVDAMAKRIVADIDKSSTDSDGLLVVATDENTYGKVRRMLVRLLQTVLDRPIKVGEEIF